MPLYIKEGTLGKAILALTIRPVKRTDGTLFGLRFI